MSDLDAAEQFLAAHARVLERRRFDHLFRGGPPGPVRDAVAAYRNDDGGFVAMALGALDEAGAWDEELVTGACDWLETVAPDGGGATFVLPDVENWPHAPWWAATEGLRPSETTTGQILAPLLRRGVEHPWVERATAWVWARAEDPGEPAPGPGAGYDALGLVSFLNAVPDAARAEAALDGLASFVAAVVKPDPAAGGELQSPLALAPRPGDRARRLFDPAHVDAFLDALAAAQCGDGGWMFGWPSWSPAAEADWRGVVTLDALVVLRANGRL
jgi:hypothetical protein